MQCFLAIIASMINVCLREVTCRRRRYQNGNSIAASPSHSTKIRLICLPQSVAVQYCTVIHHPGILVEVDVLCTPCFATQPCNSEYLK